MREKLRHKLPSALALFAAGWVASWWAHSRAPALSGAVVGGSSVEVAPQESCNTTAGAAPVAVTVSSSSGGQGVSVTVPQVASATGSAAPAFIKPSEIARYHDAWFKKLDEFLASDQPFRVNRGNNAVGWDAQGVSGALGSYEGVITGELPRSRRAIRGKLLLRLVDLSPYRPGGASKNSIAFSLDDGSANYSNTFSTDGLGRDEHSQALNVYWSNPNSRDHGEAVGYAIRLPLMMNPGQPTRLELHALDEDFTWHPVGQIVITKK